MSKRFILAFFLILSISQSKLSTAQESKLSKSTFNSSEIAADTPKDPRNPVQIEVSVAHLLGASLFTSVHFGLSKTIALGPVVGFYPPYLFTPGNPIVAYELGAEASFYFFGDRQSNSWFLSPFIYYSAFHSYRAEQPSLQAGLAIGHRWVLGNRLIISLGAGFRSVYSHLESYTYRPSGRVSSGAVDSFVPFVPSLRLNLGISL